MPEAPSQHSNALILASASPRRRQLLGDAGYEFEVIPSDVDESLTAFNPIAPEELARELARAKARTVADPLDHGAVLGADTIVVVDGKLYGKPADVDDARRILSTLMRIRHQVITGVAVIDARDGQVEIIHDVSHVTMNPMSPDQLDAYLESGLWRGKAGAYGVQDHDDAFVTKLEGSFSNVVGMPLELVPGLLARFGIHPRDNSR